MEEELKELPELLDQVIDEPTLQALVADIEGLTQVFEVLVKGAAQARASGGPLSPSQAVDMLRAGQVRGVQIRYRHEGVEWMDTLMQTPQGTRVVRMRAHV